MQGKGGIQRKNQFISLAKSKHYLLISKNYCIFVLIFGKNALSL